MTIKTVVFEKFGRKGRTEEWDIIGGVVADVRHGNDALIGTFVRYPNKGDLPQLHVGYEWRPYHLKIVQVKTKKQVRNV